MAAGTVFASADPTRYTSTGWTAYNSAGSAVAWATNSRTYLSDSDDTTFVQMTTAPFSGRGNIVMPTSAVAVTSGSAIVRARLVGRASGTGNFTLSFLNAGTAVLTSFNGSGSSSVTGYSGGWTLPSGGTTWATATLNAGSIYADTGNVALKITQLRMEYDMYSVPTQVITTTTNSDKPTASWTFTDTDSGAQSSAVVKMYTAAQYGAAGFSPDTSTATWSTVLAGAGTTTTATTAIGPTATVYRSYVQVMKDLYGVPVRSAWSFTAGTLSFSAPNSGTVTPVWDDTFKRVQLTVAGSASPFRYTLTRSGTVVGSALATMGTGTNGTTVIYDYQAPRGTAVVYSVVISNASTASPTLSANAATGTVTTGTATSWEVQSLKNPLSVLQFSSPVTGISFSRAEGQSVFRPLDATKAVVVSGAMTGDDGSVTWTTSSRSAWEALKTILIEQSPLRITSPFTRSAGGNESWIIRLTSREWSSSGVPANPVQSVSAAFVEVDPVDYGL